MCRWEVTASRTTHYVDGRNCCEVKPPMHLFHIRELKVMLNGFQFGEIMDLEVEIKKLKRNDLEKILWFLIGENQIPHERVLWCMKNLNLIVL